MNIKNLELLLKLLDTDNEKESNESNESKQSAFIVGEKYFIRTVTMAILGKLEAIFNNELVLSDASWIADTGRFHDFIKLGIYSKDIEIEPFANNVIVNRSSIIDATVWGHNLPREQQ